MLIKKKYLLYIIYNNISYLGIFNRNLKLFIYSCILSVGSFSSETMKNTTQLSKRILKKIHQDTNGEV